MKNTDTVKSGLYNIFSGFIKGELCEIAFKNKIETLCRGIGTKSYWWRFYDGDTLVNDYWSIRAMLRTHNNTEFLKECIEIALKEKSLTVYYS